DGLPRGFQERLDDLSLAHLPGDGRGESLDPPHPFEDAAEPPALAREAADQLLALGLRHGAVADVLDDRDHAGPTVVLDTGGVQDPVDARAVGPVEREADLPLPAGEDRPQCFVDPWSIVLVPPGERWTEPDDLLPRPTHDLRESIVHVDDRAVRIKHL